MEFNISGIKPFQDNDSILEKLKRIQDYIGKIQKEYKYLVNLLDKYRKNNFSDEFIKINDIIDDYIKVLKNKELKQENFQNTINCSNNFKKKM